MNVGLIDASDSRDYDGNTIKVAPLGGVQNQVVTLATELAKYHDVVVYNNVSTPSVVNGVAYRNTSVLDLFPDIDVAISVSYEGTALDPRLASVPRKIFWKHHDYPFVGDEELDAFFDTIDVFVCISNSSMNNYSKHYQSDKYTVIYNSMDVGMTVNLPREERLPHLIYASCPNRGLNTFTNILPGLHETAPGLELHAYGTFKMYGPNWQKSDDEFRGGEKYLALSGMPNFIQEASVPLGKLLRIMGSSFCLAYPSVFVESFGLTILYAMACGLPVVATNVGSIGEIYGDNEYLINVPPDDLGQVEADWYAETFISHLLDLYYSPQKWLEQSRRGIERARMFSVHKIAKEWLEIIGGL